MGTNERLANQIADDLFTNGAGEKADRLVMIQDGMPMAPDIAKARNLGGWTRGAIVSRIIVLLNTEETNAN